MVPSYYFAIVGTNDTPLYEADFGVQLKDNASASGARRDENKHISQFIAHASLDLIDDAQFTTNSCYLKTVDHYNEWNVSAYVTPSNIRLILLHESKSEDSIKGFLTDCHEIYIKTLLNPFYEPNTLIQSLAFDGKVHALARRYLL